MIHMIIIIPRKWNTCLFSTYWVWFSFYIIYDSILYSTPLKENDYIQSINDIKIAGTSVTPKECVQMVDDLPEIITIIVKRAKQKWTGWFRYIMAGIGEKTLLVGHIITKSVKLFLEMC